MKKLLAIIALCVLVFAAALQPTAVKESPAEQAQALLDAGDHEAAIPLLRAAAERGDAAAQNRLGTCYMTGAGVEENLDEAVRYFRMAADQGFANSQFNMATCYLYGLGVEKDVDTAVSYLRLAADQDLPEAQNDLAYYYQLGISVEKNEKTAVEYYRRAAGQGFAMAQANLGYCYLNGIGVEQNEEEAAKYYLLAAGQGDATAQNMLGNLYSDGTGVEQSYEEGVKFFRLAAEQGDVDGIYNLGFCYYFGEGVEPDYEKALAYFHTAADMEHPAAYFLIGESFYEGKGAEQNMEKAAEWYRKALAAGYEPDDADREHLTELLGAGFERQRAQAIIEEMVVDYGSYGEEAEGRIAVLQQELKAEDPEAAADWEQIMALWKSTSSGLTPNYDVLPDGLNDTDGLCLVVLGFQLEPDGSMRQELVERLRVAKRSAEKYPKALIVCTGGGTAAENKSATEAGKMAEWLIENGIAPERVIVEDKSLTTAQNAIYTLNILAERYPQVRELAIISSDYHIATGTLLFGAEAILRGGESVRVVSDAAWKAPSGSLSAMFQAGALIELSGDMETAFEIYYDTYDIHELPPIG